MASMNREDFKHKVDELAHEIHELCFVYPGDYDDPAYCLLTHSAENLDLINELDLV